MTHAYPMDNHHHDAVAHHQALSALLDPHTRTRITAMLPVAGATCLEVGAGHGHLAHWLADNAAGDTGSTRGAGNAAAGGHVTACDLAPEHIPAHPHLTVVGHDLTDEQWPTALDGPYDLVVARMTLAHLPPRRRILTQLADRLAPGGALLVEDWHPHPDPPVAAPTAHATALYRRYQQAVRTVLTTAGTSTDWAPAVHRHLTDEGLATVHTEVHGTYWTGGGAGTRLVGALVGQLWHRLTAHGLTDADLHTLLELLDDPRLVLHGHLLYSTSGTRPPAGTDTG